MGELHSELEDERLTKVSPDTPRMATTAFLERIETPL